MAVFGTRTARPAQWLSAGLRQRMRVGRIESVADERPVCTGILLDGESFYEGFTGLPLLLTCSHCVAPAEDVESTPGNPTQPSDVRVVFEGMFDEPGAAASAGVEQLLAASPVQRLNYCVLLLDRWPGSVTSLQLAPQAPKPGAPVFVYHYPQGGQLALSLEDNEVVDPQSAVSTLAPEEVDRLFDPLEAFVFYSAPTEGGSSGGAVFNQHWELVAMHQRGPVRSDFRANSGLVIGEILRDAEPQLAEIRMSQAIAERICGSKTNEAAADYYSVFISYSHHDAVFAHRLHTALAANGINTWLDEKVMLPGDDIYAEVATGIASWDKVLLCWSESSLSSWWVDSEIDRAFQKERELFAERKEKILALIPLNLDGYLLSTEWTSGKAQEVRSRLAVDFTGWVDDSQFEESFDRLLGALRADRHARLALPTPKL